MLSDIGLYQDCFEQAFLEQTKDFFNLKSNEKINLKMPLQTYMLFAEGLIQIEGKFAHFYLHPETFLQVVELMEAQLITNHQAYILKEMPSLLNKEWHDYENAIKTMYEFFDQTSLIP